MAERTITSLAEEAAEAAERQRVSDTDELRHFVAQWTLDDMPFCPEGMRLLLDLAKRQPLLYERAQKRFFADLAHVAYSLTGLGQHVATCADCNESGYLSHPFDGSYRAGYVPPDPPRKPN